MRHHHHHHHRAPSHAGATLGAEHRPAPVRTKRDFYRRFYAGEFGNHGPMWPTFDAWRASQYPGAIAIRSLIPGGRCEYNVPPDDVPRLASEFRRQYGSAINFSAMAPHAYNTLQGELQRTSQGLQGFVSVARNLPMRPALAVGGRHFSGLRLVQLLKSTTDAGSYDHLMELLDLYPDHVIEFLSLSRPWGVIPGMQTVVWECRLYVLPFLLAMFSFAAFLS